MSVLSVYLFILYFLSDEGFVEAESGGFLEFSGDDVLSFEDPKLVEDFPAGEAVEVVANVLEDEFSEHTVFDATFGSESEEKTDGVGDLFLFE